MYKISTFFETKIILKYLSFRNKKVLLCLKKLNFKVQLSSPKDERGLRFKDLADFNTAMLEKQFWRLIEKSNTLFSCVFKGRYFRNASRMEPIRSYSSSYGWRSIVSARSFVSKWLIKRVGSWSSISVWNDHWLPSTRPRSANKNQTQSLHGPYMWILSSMWHWEHGSYRSFGLW